MEVKLKVEEVEVLFYVLKHLKVRAKTGEIGITHGMDRFVSTQLVYKKKQLTVLDEVARKVGLQGGISRTDK